MKLELWSRVPRRTTTLFGALCDLLLSAPRSPGSSSRLPMLIELNLCRVTTVQHQNGDLYFVKASCKRIKDSKYIEMILK